MKKNIIVVNTEIVERERELYFNEIKKALLEIINVLLNMKTIKKDRNIKLVYILDTSWYYYLFVRQKVFNI